MHGTLLTVLHRGGEQEQVLACHHEFNSCPLSSTHPCKTMAALSGPSSLHLQATLSGISLVSSLHGDDTSTH